MYEIMLKASSFIFLIVLGYAMRRANVFGPEAQKVLAKINLNLTLPAIVITNFSSAKINIIMFIVLLLGIGSNLLMTFIGTIVSRKQSYGIRSAYILSCPGYNIGSFALPYVQSFLPAIGTVTVCIFDAGNALMCTGGSYAIATGILHKNGTSISVKERFLNLFSSIPLDVYIFMFLFSLLGGKVPASLLTLIKPMANANVFIAMFMLGLMFQLELKVKFIKRIIHLLSIRMAWAVIFSLFIWFVLPFELVVRQSLILVAFAPITSVAPPFVQKLDGDVGFASCVNSMSILVSIVVITGLITVMGL